MRLSVFVLFSLFSAFTAPAQMSSPGTAIALGRDSTRVFFGTYRFTTQFQMKVFSINDKVFAQRVGDAEKFQIFPKSHNVFFLTAMPAEIEFRRSAQQVYDTLILRQGGKEMLATRQSADPFELYDTVLHLDRQLYEAYDRRDLKAFMAFFSPGLEFYHDLTGKTDYKANLETFKENFSKSATMRRVLLPGSLEVYPIKDYGAIQTGTHQFYQKEAGGAERLVAQPRFMHIWQRTSSGWKITRIVSYDH